MLIDCQQRSMPNRNRKIKCEICNSEMRSDNYDRHMSRADHKRPKESEDREGGGVPQVSTSDDQHIRKKDYGRTKEPESREGSSVPELSTIGDYSWKDKGPEKNHSFLLPRNIRAIIIGKSGHGKSTLLNYLLLHPDMLDYDTLTVCGRSLHQPEYRIMRSAFAKGLSKNQVNGLFRIQEELEDPEDFIQDYEGRCKGGIDATFNDKVEDMPDPSEHDPDKKNLLVFDDIMLSPQNKCEAYYTRGRHNNVDVFYIAQSYFRLPRQTVRENANLFMFFIQDSTNLSHIYQDHCAVDNIPYQVFKDFCADVWSQKHNFVTIDLTRPATEGKYRRNLNDFWIPDVSSS